MRTPGTARAATDLWTRLDIATPHIRWIIGTWIFPGPAFNGDAAIAITDTSVEADTASGPAIEARVTDGCEDGRRKRNENGKRGELHIREVRNKQGFHSLFVFQSCC